MAHAQNAPINSTEKGDAAVHAASKAHIKLQPVRGTHDCWPEAHKRRSYIIATAREIFARYGYGEITLPIFEFTEVFARTLGETSDIVSKEMYSFTDRGGEGLTLRPELTAGIARAYISGGMAHMAPHRLFSIGAAFRYERPQKGRLRQFHQIDAEILGLSDPLTDADMIAMGHHLLAALGLQKATELEINSLGDAESRANHRKALVDYFTKHQSQLSEESQIRLAKNPLRILDSKDAGDKALVAGAPMMADYYNEPSKQFFDNLRRYLDKLGIAYTRNPHLVRGMDYYNHTVFEFTTTHLGAQNAVLSGGRYDGLIEQMGGSPTPAIGWAAGLERLEALTEILSTPIPVPLPQLVIAPLSEDDAPQALVIAQNLRQTAWGITLDNAGALKKRFARADKAGAAAIMLVGGDEAARGAVTIKWLKESQQEECPISALQERFSA